MRKNALLSIAAMALSVSTLYSQNQESITITTYYPSPFGSYDQLGVNKLAVDVPGVATTTEYADMRNGDAHIGTSLIVGTAAGFSYDALNAVTSNQPANGGVLMSGSLGIGTPQPQGKIHILNDGGGQDQGILLEAARTAANQNLYPATYGIYVNRLGRLHIAETSRNGRVRFIVTPAPDPQGPQAFIAVHGTTGNVGIGTSTPETHFQVKGREGRPSVVSFIRGDVGPIGGIPDINVGIGTTNPQSRLQVVGGVQVGADDNANPNCSADKAGTLRYKAPNMEYCNGDINKWVTYGSTMGWVSVNAPPHNGAYKEGSVVVWNANTGDHRPSRICSDAGYLFPTGACRHHYNNYIVEGWMGASLSPAANARWQIRCDAAGLQETDTTLEILCAR